MYAKTLKIKEREYERNILMLLKSKMCAGFRFCFFNHVDF